MRNENYVITKFLKMKQCGILENENKKETTKRIDRQKIGRSTNESSNQQSVTREIDKKEIKDLIWKQKV